MMGALQFITAGSRSSLEVTDKGKTGESRRRKATRLPRDFSRHASRAADSHYRGGRIQMRAFTLAVTGLAFVTACSGGGTSTEIVHAAVASISVSLPSSLAAGQKARGTAIPRDANGNPLSGRTVSWQSLSSSVATVSDSGMISAVAPGTAVISASSEGVSGQASMDVVAPAPAPVASVSVALGASSLNPGQTTQATATTRDANNNVLTGRTVTWGSSNTGVATVSTSGLVTAVAVGSAQITGTSEGQSGSATITVTSAPPVPVASVSVSLGSSSINAGQTTQATATTRDANGNVLTGRTISWGTSNGGIATVSGSGVVTGVAAGTAQITATSEGQSGSATITITVPPPPPVANVSVSLAATTLNIGQTTQATATTRDANGNVLTGRTITWSTSNATVATVSGSGVVTAVTAGTAQITATSEGKSGSATLTVNAPAPVPVARVTVSLGTSTLNPGQTTQATAITYDASNNVLTGRVIGWSSTNTSVATVSSSGLVTAVATGSAQITATSEGQSGSAGLTVSAPPPPPPSGSNEPSGMTLISERPFNALQEDPTWDTDNTLSIFSDPSAPKSAPNVLRATYPTGYSSGGSAPGHAGRTIGSYRVLYISYWGKLSDNFFGHDSGVNKQVYAWTGGNPSFYMNARGVGTATLVPEVTFQGTTTDGGQGLYLPNLVPSAHFTRGAWFHIEILLTGNTSGAANGTFDWWLDGVHVGSHSNYQFTSGTTGWNVFEVRPVWGGVGGPDVPATMTFDMDHVYLSGKN